MMLMAKMTMNNPMAHHLVSLETNVAAPAEENAWEDPAPPKADERPPALSFCTSTRRIKPMQPTTWIRINVQNRKLMGKET